MRRSGSSKGKVSADLFAVALECSLSFEVSFFLLRSHTYAYSQIQTFSLLLRTFIYTFCERVKYENFSLSHGSMSLLGKGHVP